VAPTAPTFASLDLAAPLLKALADEGYTTPTPIQAQSIPPLLQGRDLLGIAQTGTGKTAAFALPILQKLSASGTRPERGTCRALILSPTRELCAQILDSFRTYGANTKLRGAVVFGGVSINRQIEQCRHGLDILVATPGRLVDLIQRRALSLSKVEIFVLDEVDQMLDLGFIHAIRKLTAQLPPQRQNLFFSATMPKEIAALADGLLHEPVRVEITPVATTAERVTQSVIHVDPSKKAMLLVDLLRDPKITRSLVFTRTKHGADKVVKGLEAEGIRAAAIHGNKSQANRERALHDFRSGRLTVLVATDIAARGIDIDGISHVFNYDLPYVPESYVHRIGRTARAGAAGEAIAFCTQEDRPLLRDIEKTIRQPVPQREHPLGLTVVWPEPRPGQGQRPAGVKPARKPGQGGRPFGRHVERDRPEASGERMEHASREPGREPHHAERRPERPRQDQPRQDRPYDDRPREHRARSDQGRDHHGRDGQGRDGRDGHGRDRQAHQATQKPAKSADWSQRARASAGDASPARGDDRSGGAFARVARHGGNQGGGRRG
jgi:ATP-dependent RNA helicase RhlE